MFNEGSSFDEKVPYYSITAVYARLSVVVYGLITCDANLITVAHSLITVHDGRTVGRSLIQSDHGSLTVLLMPVTVCFHISRSIVATYFYYCPFTLVDNNFSLNVDFLE